MSRYFFDIQNAGTVFEDRQGQDLAGPEAARLAAAGLLVSAARRTAPDQDDCSIIAKVRDETGSVAFTSTLSLHYGRLA